MENTQLKELTKDDNARVFEGWKLEELTKTDILQNVNEAGYDIYIFLLINDIPELIMCIKGDEQRSKESIKNNIGDYLNKCKITLMDIDSMWEFANILLKGEERVFV